MAAVFEKKHIPVSLIVSSSPNAYGLKRAKRRSVPTLIFHKDSPQGIATWKSLIAELKNYNIEYILLAGFMKILPLEFLKEFEGRVFNIHPSLLPQYPGIKSIQRAFEDGNDSGVSLHVVDEGVDTGEIVLQRRVSKQESFEWFELMIHIKEHISVRRAVETLWEKR